MLSTRKLGRQGLEVSAIGLGCMSMTTSADVDEAAALATLERAVELGCTFLDTAEVYGPYRNEALLGRFLKTRRDEVTVATKFGWEIADNRMTGEVDARPEVMRASVEGSLRRLGIDTIDLYYQHRVDPDVPVEEIVGAMSRLIDEGKVRYLGLSEAGAANIRRAHATHPISALQSEYSLWERNLEDGIIPVLRELGIGLVPFSPLGRGFLTGAATRAEDLPAGDFRKNDPRLQGGNFDANLAAAQAVQAVAARLGATGGQVALAWLLHKGPDIVPIPGTKRRKYLEENVAAAELTLSAQDMAELDAAMTQVAGPRYAPAMMAKVDR